MTQKPERIAPPAEFDSGEDVGDIEAYWDAASPDRNTKSGEGPGARYGHDPITFTPLFVTLIDNTMQVGKASTLIHCRLDAPATLRSADKDEGDIEFPAGAIIGIWAKAGMKELKKLGGAKCWMSNGQNTRHGVKFFKDLGIPGQSPMVLFTIRHTGTGKVLEVKNDYRNEALPENIKARIERKKQQIEERAEAAPIDLDDIPF